ncbi:hypothetical protein EIP86_009290 [Pleurotus ostreatoroseus]|nr:hypothetical protein EIP86_009290 [Pleurotus ostreatoroseus]
MNSNVVSVAGENTQTSASRAAVLQALDEHDRALTALSLQYSREVFRIQCAKQVLRSQYNTLAPISRLPTELLSLIFRAFVDDYWASSEQEVYVMPGLDIATYESSMCGWLVVLHVCRRWRSVALGEPSLWTRIELRCEPFVTLALARSGSLPLDVFAGQESFTTPRREYYAPKTLGALLPVFPRLRTFQWFVTRATEKAFESGQELQAPLMESLILRSTGRNVSSVPGLAKMYLPRLHSLTIENGSISLLDTFIRPTLTTLNISFSPAHASELIKALERLPLLQRLVLFGAIRPRGPSLIQRLPPGCHTISLPSLQSLAIETPFRSPDIAHFFDCLDYPVDTMIMLTIGMDRMGETIEPADFDEHVLSRILSKARVSTEPKAAPAAPPCVIEVLGSFETLVEVNLMSDVPARNGDASNRHIATRHFDLTYEMPKPEGYKHVFNYLDLSQVVVLDLYDNDVDREAWMAAFRHRTLPKLNELILTGNKTTEAVLSVMSTPLSQSSTSTASATPSGRETRSSARAFLFPTLKTLKLVFCTFRNKPDKVLRGDLIPSVLEALRDRAKHGYKLARLIISRPVNLTRKADLSALRDPRIAHSTMIDTGTVEA